MEKPSVPFFPYLPHTCAIVAREAAVDFIGRGCDVAETLTVGFLCFSAQTSDGQDLPILLDSLLELAEQNAEA